MDGDRRGFVTPNIMEFPGVFKGKPSINQGPGWVGKVIDFQVNDRFLSRSVQRQYHLLLIKFLEYKMSGVFQGVFCGLEPTSNFWVGGKIIPIGSCQESSRNFLKSWLFL